MKNNITLKISATLVIVSLLLIIIGFISLNKDRLDTNNQSKITKYVCMLENQLTKSIVSIKYEAILDQNNNITNLYGEKKYLFDDRVEYLNWLHSTSKRNVNYTYNLNDLTITIYMINGNILDENGEIIYPNYLEYMSQYITDEYSCQLIYS